MDNEYITRNEYEEHNLRMDDEHERMRRRIGKLELQTEAIQQLATSVEVMVKEQSHQTEAIGRIEKNVEKLDGKVEILEDKPGKRWDNVVDKIVMTVVGAIIGYILVRIGLG